jgi:superfamily I DNA and/or RNA helicase
VVSVFWDLNPKTKEEHKSMLFNKYQYNNNDIRKRGYSQTCVVRDENEDVFWVKWILGIERASTKAGILTDELRRLRKARHTSLPEIIEYGFDDEQQAFAIVFRYLSDVYRLEESYQNIKIQEFIGGLIELADCLSVLHQKNKIHHGDIHPANILVDENRQFYLIDFGLSDITKTLSQEKDLQIFARDFAAPEKFNKSSLGFPYQSDIYSLGKVIEWFFSGQQEDIPKEQNGKLQRLLAEDPVERPNWQEVIDFLKNLATVFDTGMIWVAFRDSEYVTKDFAQTLFEVKPIFDISPKEGDNYLMDIIIGKYLCKGVLWIIAERKLLFNEIESLDSSDDKKIEIKKRNGKKLPLNHSYTEDCSEDCIDLTPYFQKWFNAKLSLSENRSAVREELWFYEELLKKEKEVIRKHSIRLQYYKCVINGNGDGITFYIEFDEKYSSIGAILKHIDEGNDVNSDGFEYVLSTKADRKPNNEEFKFSGKPYSLEEINNPDKDEKKKYALKIKDCEFRDTDRMPLKGYLREDTIMAEAEKDRQLDAIGKVGKNEVQNPDLIYYLFRPDELQGSCVDRARSLDVKQKDAGGKPFEYSHNQTKAIQNALFQTPLSVIQGPPGTGKTTVITEIVFQILARKPESKILITSQTNNAVDQVLENLLENDISILRLCGITLPKVHSIRDRTMGKILAGWKKQVIKTTEKNFKARAERYKQEFGERFDELKNLQLDWMDTVSALDERSAINQKLINCIHVIGATCNHIASAKYRKYNFEFDYVIMDESGKATTAEALVPIILGENLVFVGDHRQLRPMLTNTREVESWLREKYKKDADGLEGWEDYINRPSLFERVIKNIDSDYKVQLTECRRMSKEQVLLTSKCFYETEGDDAIVPVERELEKEHNLPLTINSSVIFVDIGNDYENEKDTNRSSYNMKSQILIPEILKLLDKCDKVKKYSFGVITGYTAQCHGLKRTVKRVINNELRNISNNEDKLTVQVIDRFQGLERDIVIVDLVKSGIGLDLGFLEVPNRINVGLSRQKRLLIIVGDYSGIVNAKTRSGKKAALQMYLEEIKPEWIIKAKQIGRLLKNDRTRSI